MKNSYHTFVNRLRLLAVIMAVSIILPSCGYEEIMTPAESKDFEQPSGYEEIIDFCKNVAKKNPLLEMEVIGHSVGGRDLVVLTAGKRVNKEAEPLRVLLFAQQHGNEQASKEAGLLILKEIATGSLDHWFDDMELWIVPQVNPDGSELNQRRNQGGHDLNRDHLVLEAPETIALHRLFQGIMPHVNIDLHEYQPYTESWRSFGAYKDFDVQVGINTNINIAENIRKFSLERALPAIGNHLEGLGYSFHNYIVGPPPSEGITRYSTTHIDDGRQSFGILNTVSFIFEGKNGRDGFSDNLMQRSISQAEAIKALLEFLTENSVEVKDIVNNAREQLVSERTGEKVAIRTEYAPDGSALPLNLKSATTGEDTLVMVENYKPLVVPEEETTVPLGYLIPRHDPRLKEWINNHGLYRLNNMPANASVYGWYLRPISYTEGRRPLKRRVDLSHAHEQYVYLPSGQLHSNFLVLSLEPLSDIGLVQENSFEYLLSGDDWYPIYRVEP